MTSRDVIHLMLAIGAQSGASLPPTLVLQPSLSALRTIRILGNARSGVPQIAGALCHTHFQLATPSGMAAIKLSLVRRNCNALAIRPQHRNAAQSNLLAAYGSNVAMAFGSPLKKCANSM
jgi:hypothetical protein